MVDQPPMPPAATGPVTPQPPSVAWYRRRWWKLPVWAWIAIAVVVIGAAAGSSPKKEKEASAPAATLADSPSTTDAVTAPPTTAKPTTTTALTTTLAPTTTAPPQPVVFSGRGDDVVNLPSTDLVVATISYQGRGNFVIWALDAGLTQTDLLVNEIGSYNGRVPVNLRGDSTALQVEAGGEWTISLLPITHAVHYVGTSLSGSGDDVLFVEDTAIYSITHNGQSNFVVWVYSEDGTDLAVNEIGNYSGNVPVRGPAIVVVSADGAWTITKS